MHRRTILTTSTAALLPLGALSKEPTAPSMNALRVTEESGFKTYAFKMLQSKIAKHPQGGDLLLIWFGGNWNGRDTRIGMTLDLSWEAAKPRAAFPMWLGIVGFASVGAESNAFVEEFARSLGEPVQPRSVAEDLAFETVTLGAKPTKSARTFECKAIRTGTEGYCEFYLRIDLSGQRVVIAEKDAEYRKALVGAFTQPT